MCKACKVDIDTRGMLDFEVEMNSHKYFLSIPRSKVNSEVVVSAMEGKMVEISMTSFGKILADWDLDKNFDLALLMMVFYLLEEIY